MIDKIIIFNPPGLKDSRRNLRKSSTEAEKILWQNLRNKKLGQRFYRQFGIEHFVVDFCCWKKKLIIEVDGEVHNKTEVAERDIERQNFLEDLGFKILRFKNEEVLENIQNVIKEIRSGLLFGRRSSLPRPPLS